MATVEKRILRDGTPRFKITIAAGIGINGKQRRVHKMWSPQIGMTERQIEKALGRAVTDFEREIEQGYQADNRQRFADYAIYVISLKERTGAKTRTIERYRELLKRINSAIGHIKIADIRPQHLNAFYANLAEKGVRLSKDKAVIKIDLRAWLAERHLSVAEFARQIGISSTTLFSVSKKQYIEYDTAEILSRAINIPVAELFDVKREDKPLSAKTIVEHHRLISTILAQAEKEMLIPFNPATRATPPKANKSTPDYYQPDVIEKIIAALEYAPAKWKAITYLLMDTGCRRGEIAGLKWESIDFNTGIIDIERALLYSSKKGIYEDTTKTGQTRVLKIAPETLSVLMDWKKEQDEAKEVYGCLWVENGFVFTQYTGEKIHPDSITDWLRKFSQKNALPHIHPHAFRHTAASTMIANGVDLVTAANELGHSNATTTAAIYAHQIAEAKARAENIRASIFRKKP